MPETPDYEYRNPLDEDAVALEPRSLGDLAGEVVYLLPGCAPLMIRKELQNAWADFAARSGAFRFPMRRRLEKGVREYRFSPPADAAVREVRNLRFGFMDGEGGTVRLRPRFWMRHAVSWRCAGAEAVVRLAVAVDDAFLESDNFISLELECRPRVGSEDIPFFVYDRWGRAIVAGALQRLCSMPNRPWSDAAVAARSQVEYENALNEASLDLVENRRGEVNATNWEGWA